MAFSILTSIKMDLRRSIFISFTLHLFCIIVSAVTDTSSQPLGPKSNLTTEENIAVKNFRDYLRINTAHPNPNYDPAIEWIQSQAKALGLSYNILRYPESKEAFVIWLTWTGSNPELDSVLLYSHIDVVPADASEWENDPFEAYMDSDGNIFGRGAQDMKSVGVQYLEAIRNLKSKGVVPNRTIHILYIPDEENGETKGMKLFILTPEFKALRIGFALDEGLPTDDPTRFDVLYGQRESLWLKITARGNSGHGSSLLDDTAAEKLRRVINKFLDIREKEKARYDGARNTLTLGDVTSINLNIIEGGTQVNIIPSKLSATFDIRMSPNSEWDSAKFQMVLNETCLEAGPNVTYEVLFSSPGLPLTSVNESSWWWEGFQKAFAAMYVIGTVCSIWKYAEPNKPGNFTLNPRIFPAGSDGQLMREKGVPTLGISPIFNTTMRFHARDEYLNVDVFLKGIKIYERLVQELAYVGPSTPKSSKGKSSSSTLDMHTGMFLLMSCLLTKLNYGDDFMRS